MRLLSTTAILALLAAPPAFAAEPGGEAGATLPETLHPALSVSWWRPTRGAGTYGASPSGDVTLWQGDWGLGGGGTQLNTPVATGGVTDSFDNGAAVAHVTLRRRFTLPGLPAAPPATLIGEAGWQGLFPVAPGFMAVGLGGVLPIKPGVIAVEGNVRGGPYATGGGFLIDARAGFQVRLGPASIGAGWRHLALGGSRISNLTGPQFTATLAF